MGVQDYGVLRGTLLETGREDDASSPHFQIIVGVQAERWRVPVNVRSGDARSPNVLYLVEDPFAGHPILSRLGELAPGFTSLPQRQPGLTLDFVRDALAGCADMRVLPHSLPGADNDLQDLLELHVRRLAREPGAEIFAWGARFIVKPNDQRPADVKFRTTRGVHDIHMNQGNPNPGDHARDNGIHQDGGLLLSFPGSGTFVAILLAFQSQTFDTDEQGHPRPGAGPCGAPASGGDARPDPVPAPAGGDLRIVAALVNPTGDDPGLETVTLLNTSGADVDLAGWTLEDRQNKSEALSGVLAAGETRRIRLTGRGAQLSNKGGVITLKNPGGARVHAVSYAKAEAGSEGRTLVFGS